MTPAERVQLQRVAAMLQALVDDDAKALIHLTMSLGRDLIDEQRIKREMQPHLN